MRGEWRDQAEAADARAPNKKEHEQRAQKSSDSA